MSASEPEPGGGSFSPSPWPRLLVGHGLQALPVALVCFASGAAAYWTAGLLGSVICCATTDSGWRWLNRVMVLEASLWLLLPLVLAI